MPITPKIFAVALAALSISLSAVAVEPGPAAKSEVDQLLTRLASSGCTFQRNGSWHSAGEARAHLEKKYQYLLDKKRIGSAEDFVSLAATQSSSSGKPYLVKCGAQEQPSAAWMGSQLKDLRAHPVKK
jgi:hypothetical protein